MGNPNMDWSPVRKTGSARPRESPSYSPYRADDQRAYDSDGYRPGRPGPYSTTTKPPFGKVSPRRPFEPTPTDRYRHDDFHQPWSPRRRMEDGHQMRSPRPSGLFQDFNRPSNNRPRPFQDSPPSSPRPPRPNGPRSDPFDDEYFDSRPQPSGSAERKGFMEGPNFVSNSSLTWKRPTSRDSSRSKSSRQPYNGSGSENPPRSSGPVSSLVSGSVGMTFAEQDFQRQLVEGRSWVVTREELPALMTLPHIFISARHVPYKSTATPHIARLLRSAHKEVRVQGCVDGYYLSFRNNSDGRAGLRRCVERHDRTLLFNKFEMVMEPHLPGLDSSSSQDLPPVTHAQQQKSAEMSRERNLPPASTASPAQTTMLNRHSPRPDTLQKPSDNISSERNLSLNNPHQQNPEMSSQHNVSPNVPPTRTMKPPDRNPNTPRQQITKTSNQHNLHPNPLQKQGSKIPRQRLDEAEDIAIQGAASRVTPTEKVMNFLQQCENSGVVAIFDHAKAWGLPKGRPGWSVKLKVDELEIGDLGPHPSKIDASAAIVGRGFRLLKQALQAQDRKSPAKRESPEGPEASTDDTTVESAAANANIRRLQEDMNSRLSRAKELEDWLVANPTAEEATIERSRGYYNDIMDRVEGIRQEIIKLGGLPASTEERHGADESSPPPEPLPRASSDKELGGLPASAEVGHGVDESSPPLVKQPPPLASVDNEPGAHSASAESHGSDESSPPLFKQPPPLPSADKEPGVDHHLFTSRDSISATDHGQARHINEPTRRKSTTTLSDASEASSKTKVTRCAYCKTKHFPSYNPKKICSGCRRAYCSSCWKTESARAPDSNAEPESCRHCVKSNTQMLSTNHESHSVAEQPIAPKTSEPKVTTPPVDIPQPAQSTELETREAPSPICHDERLENEHREGPAETSSQAEKRLLERSESNRGEAPAASPSHAEIRMLPDPDQAERSDAPAASPSHTGTGTIPGGVQTDRTEASELYLKKLSGINGLSWSDLLGFALVDNGNRGMTVNEISAWIDDNFRDAASRPKSSSVGATLSGVWQKHRFSHVMNSKPSRYYASDAFSQNCTERLSQLRAQARYIVKLPFTQFHKLGVEKSAVQGNETTGPQGTQNMDGTQETNEKNLKRPREKGHEEVPTSKAPRKFAYRARKSASNGKRLQPPVKQGSVRISAPASGPDGVSSAGSQSEATPGPVENQELGFAPKSVEVISLSSDSSSDESRPVSPAPLSAPRDSLRSVSPEPVSAPPDLSRPVSPASDSDPLDSPQDPRMAFALATLERAKSLPGSRPVTMPEDLVVNGFSKELQDRLTARYKAEYCNAPTIVKDLAKEAPAFCPPPFDREAKIAEIKARPKRKARLEALNAKVDAPRLLHARQERPRDAIHKEEYRPLPPAYKPPPPGAWSLGFGATHDLTASQETDDVDMDADNEAPRRKERGHFEADDTDVDMDADNEAPQPKEKDYVETVEEWLGGPPADSVTYMITDRGKLAFREKAVLNRDGRMPRPRKVWVVPD